jgi:hypothetical protein
MAIDCSDGPGAGPWGGESANLASLRGLIPANAGVFACGIPGLRGYLDEGRVINIDSHLEMTMMVLWQPCFLNPIC